ncbi:MAG: ABC-F family ATP-binding cassette domain-containing protein [Candidatus Zixiibacteriota bacterium]|nr:MAG: ABC-F family ATP-binding cassette domain-containing protein [candidate division Zixibacteria bacterium]
MILTGFSGINKSYSSRPVLKNVTGVVKDGDRIALLGANGTGKTTLLEILAGKLVCDTGNIETPNAVKRQYLPQEIKIDDNGSLFDYAMSGLNELMELRAGIERVHDKLAQVTDDPKLLSELGGLQERFETAGGYEMETKTRLILIGVGFGPGEFDMQMKALSGGQRNRAALARILISAPDLLILDEPTNHLDISGLEFLEEYLKSYEGGIIFVSHDRAFIQNTATSIWELSGCKLDIYQGNYDFYLGERERRFIAGLKEYEAQKEFIKRTEDFISRNIAGQKTKQAQSRRKMLTRLHRFEKPSSEKTISQLNFGNAGRSARSVVKCMDVSFSYDDKPFLRNIEFEIERGEKIGLFGPNGSGKTTVIKLITGKIEPDEGAVEIGGKTSIGYYDQLAEDLNPDSNPLDTIRSVKPEWIDSQIRGFLGRFLFSGEDVIRPIKSFSGGERSRLAIARIIVNEPNFLVLDEPTNHLDIVSREALEKALADYGGAVFCVSHDRYFLDSFIEKILAVENGAVKIFFGNYSDYKEKKEREFDRVRPEKTKSVLNKPADIVRERRVNPQILNKIENKIAGLEDKIVNLENEIAGLEGSSDWQKLTALLGTREEYYRELESLHQELDDLKSGNS